jgi:hypothetical protein
MPTIQRKIWEIALMDYAALDFWWKVAMTAMNVGMGLYLYLVNRNRVTNERIGKLETGVDDRLDNHTERLARLEQDVRHAPTHDDLKRLHARIDEVNNSLKRLEGEFSGANHTLGLIHEHLLKGGGK